MKILFYETKKYEREEFLNKLKEDIEPYFFENPLINSTYIDERFKDTDAISCFVGSILDEKTLEKFKNLKYIFLRCVGYSNIDLIYCKKHNIKVFNAKNYGSSTVAEYVFTLILNLIKKIPMSQKSIETGEIISENLMGYELNSKTMGVVGAGAIGRKVINIAHGFDMEVLVYDIFKKGAYHFVELDELFEKSDFIVLTCPLTQETKGLINKNNLSKMKKSAILINVARGEIIDTKALLEALLEKKIKGAALDVIECEQMLCQNHENCLKFNEQNEYCAKKYFFIRKLTQLKNVIITPHNAYNTKEALERIIKITCENIKQAKNENSSAENLILL